MASAAELSEVSRRIVAIYLKAIGFCSDLMDFEIIGREQRILTRANELSEECDAIEANRDVMDFFTRAAVLAGAPSRRYASYHKEALSAVDDFLTAILLHRLEADKDSNGNWIEIPRRFDQLDANRLRQIAEDHFINLGDMELIEVKLPQEAASASNLCAGELVQRSAQNIEANGRPVWDSERGHLSYRGQIIRKYKRQAKNLRRVLDAFQEEGWPPRIDDPLPAGKNQSRVNDTVKSLNANLRAIRFHADGSGGGFHWEPSPASTL